MPEFFTPDFFEHNNMFEPFTLEDEFQIVSPIGKNLIFPSSLRNAK
jgi:hypothetical protein